jgi:hypothetical protein
MPAQVSRCNVCNQCRSSSRRVDYALFQFDFLGCRFRPRGANSRAGTLFTGFLPAISPKATKAIRRTIRGWRLRGVLRYKIELVAGAGFDLYINQPLAVPIVPASLSKLNSPP